MTKQSFIANLKARLSGLSRQDVIERLNFYSEMIDDRMEEGLSEEDAVLAVGSVEKIAEQIKADISLDKNPDENVNKRRLKAWEIILLALGSPIWLSLIIAAAAIVISVYAVVWSLIICVWAIELPFLIFSFISKYLVIVCKKLTEGALFLTKGGASYIKKTFSGRGKI